MKELSSEAIVIRHGKTPYLNEGIDLTDKGIEETKETAKNLKDYLKQFDEIIVVSSPLPRTMGTAKVFLEEIGMKTDVKIMNSIRCVDIYDLQKFNEFSDANSTEVYGQMWFNNPEIKEGTEFAESSNSVNKRAYRFLYHIGNFIRRKTLKENKRICVVAFTHFEIGSNYLRNLYPDNSIFPDEGALGLNNSEPVVMSFTPDSEDIIVKARGKEGIISTNELSLTKEI